jgi:hypothetical protein
VALDAQELHLPFMRESIYDFGARPDRETLNLSYPEVPPMESNEGARCVQDFVREKQESEGNNVWAYEQAYQAKRRRALVAFLHFRITDHAEPRSGMAKDCRHCQELAERLIAEFPGVVR